ncbi:hypothetical protein SAMN04488028_11217 [Reichenbachiella agariperforans]|uniref:Uncharacterized protein n=1 Tax=Reichenbachiella agariperforans TaxID=156994 RepID=A0A1M6WG84_REIAG|nr:hypothetical protein SAMN04488028_11217 [Reichenbachiella agariperforans]
MIVAHIEIVTIVVTILFLTPIVFQALKKRLYKKITFQLLVNILNYSLLIQSIIGVVLMIFVYLFPYEHTPKKLNSILSGSSYTYSVIGVFCIIPSVLLLNFVYMITNMLKRKNT